MFAVEPCSPRGGGGGRWLGWLVGGFCPSFTLPFLSSPQEASGRGPVGTDAFTFPSWLCCIISCGITSANALLSSHCVETLVLCQTVGQGALKQKIRLRRREITGTARSRTHVHILFVFEGVYLIRFTHFNCSYFECLYKLSDLFTYLFYAVIPIPQW